MTYMNVKNGESKSLQTLLIKFNKFRIEPDLKIKLEL